MKSDKGTGVIGSYPAAQVGLDEHGIYFKALPSGKLSRNQIVATREKLQERLRSSRLGS